MLYINRVHIPVAQYFYFSISTSCFPLSLLKATSTPTNHPFHHIAFLITVRSSEFIFLESFSPRDFLVSSLTVFFCELSSKKWALCVSVCVYTCVCALKAQFMHVNVNNFQNLTPLSLLRSFCSLSTSSVLPFLSDHQWLPDCQYFLLRPLLYQWHDIMDIIDITEILSSLCFTAPFSLIQLFSLLNWYLLLLPDLKCRCPFRVLTPQ